jgi:hypothetical protein
VVAQSETKSKILEVLRDADGPMTPKEVTEVTKLRENTVRVTLARMAKGNEIRLFSRGQYARLGD